MWSSFELFKVPPLKMAPYSTLWENIANVSFHWLHSTLKHLCVFFLLYKRKTRWLPLLDIVLTEDKWENITQKLLHWWNLNSTLMIIWWSFKKFVFLCWLEKIKMASTIKVFSQNSQLSVKPNLYMSGPFLRLKVIKGFFCRSQFLGFCYIVKYKIPV